ncbi:hypothetical protein [Homoserinibacter sp. GY 40078]|uniref:hypothetical protein n=1 Tax=Homoserinibacter sp. GY 40078 TaxID=2603275 RepID=UPI0011CB1962|nr:hypothetical protein [Homoserinibacter sp. GY 40078]TXK18542.1 hypothetical protein FVQ89_00870 [Homoserinibacter sp. GY 40078]
MVSLRTRNLRIAAGIVAVAGVVAIAAVPSAIAGFRDTTYIVGTYATDTPPLMPVRQDQSGASVLYLSSTGELYLGGKRTWGDGAGNQSVAADSKPTKVSFPAGTVIVDAMGTTNDFSTITWTNCTAFAALDSQGRVWTWGSVLPCHAAGSHYIGRGALTGNAPYSPGIVQTEAGASLPRIIDLEIIENQFLALDEQGRMWAWGHEYQNLPLSTVAKYPTVANTVAVLPGAGVCTGANDGGTVTWHSIWGGTNGAAAVATNGLIYTWGYDNAGVNAIQVEQRCPLLNEPANRALFDAYPQLYRDAQGRTYDESVLLTETDRTARYQSIVTHMKGRDLAVCAKPVAKPELVDTSGCPVRQFGFSARAPRMLLADHDLYTWRVATETVSGAPLLGRTSTSTDYRVAGSGYRPAVALRGVDHVVAGIGSLKALMLDGTVMAWGRNPYCEAVSAPTGVADCSKTGATDVLLPQKVNNVPTDIVRLYAGVCSTWAESANGKVWAWGAGRVIGHDFVTCYDYAAVAVTRITDFRTRTPDNIFGTPVTTPTSRTLRVR